METKTSGTQKFLEIKGCYVMKRDYKEKKSVLLGFLPERRKDPTREKGRKSLLKLAHKTFDGIVEDIHSIWLIDDFK